MPNQAETGGRRYRDRRTQEGQRGLVTEHDLKLTKEPVRISVIELLDERRIGLVVRAFNIALKEAGCGWLKARISHPTKEYLSFDIWKVDKSKEHLV